MNNYLRKYRKAAKMTQAELAKAVGTSPVVICRYETGKRIPKISTASRIAEVLGCKVDDIWPVT